MDDAQQAPTGPIDEAAAAAPTGGSQLNAQAVEEKMELPDQLREPFDRVLAAGRQVLYSKETREDSLAFLTGEGDVSKRLGDGAAGLMGMLMEQSNNSLPPPVIIPVGVVLIADAADFLREAGTDVTDEQVAEAMSVFVDHVLTQSGIDPAKAPELLQGVFAGQAAPAQQAPAGQQPTPPGPPAGVVDSEVQ